MRAVVCRGFEREDQVAVETVESPAMIADGVVPFFIDWGAPNIRGLTRCNACWRYLALHSMCAMEQRRR